MARDKSRKSGKKMELMQLVEELREANSFEGMIGTKMLSAELQKAALGDLSILGFNIERVCNGIVRDFLESRKLDIKQPGLSYFELTCMIPCGVDSDTGDHMWILMAWATKAHVSKYLGICKEEFDASKKIEDKRREDFAFLNLWDERKYKHFKDFKEAHSDLFESKGVDVEL